MVRARKQPVTTPTGLPYGEAGQLAATQSALGLPAGGAPAPQIPSGTPPPTGNPAPGGPAVPTASPASPATPAIAPPTPSLLSAPTGAPDEHVMTPAANQPLPLPDASAVLMREALREFYTPALHDVVVELGLRNR